METKKPTLATLKAFIKRELKNKNLFVKTRSSFDGSIDCVASVKDIYRKVDGCNFEEKNTFGIGGVWLVGRDYIENYADDFTIGYEVSNCCGSFIIGMEKLYRK